MRQISSNDRLARRRKQIAFSPGALTEKSKLFIPPRSGEEKGHFRAIDSKNSARSSLADDVGNGRVSRKERKVFHSSGISERRSQGSRFRDSRIQAVAAITARRRRVSRDPEVYELSIEDRGIGAGRVIGNHVDRNRRKQSASCRVASHRVVSHCVASRCITLRYVTLR